MFLATHAEPALSADFDRSPTVTVSYSLPSPTLSLHEPVFIEARVENRGEEPVIADFGGNYQKHLYLRRALDKTTRVDWILLDGLARIANLEARDLLATLANSPGERGQLARGALARFGQVP